MEKYDENIMKNKTAESIPGFEMCADLSSLVHILTKSRRELREIVREEEEANCKKIMSGHDKIP